MGKALRALLAEPSCVKQVLDVGCGEGELSRKIMMLAPQACVTGIDVLPDRIESARQGYPHATFLVSDIETFESDQTYDLITAIDVLEHTGDDQLALERLNRLLKMGGKLLISVPHSMRYWTRMDETGGHYRRYSKMELVTKLEEGGFSIVSVKTYGFPIPVLWLYLKNLLNRSRSLNEESLAEGNHSFIFRVSSLLKYPLFLNIDVGLGLNFLVIARKTENR